MVRTGWKWLFRATAAALVVMASSPAAAQPQDFKAPPHLVAPRIDVRASAPPAPPGTMNRATAAAIGKIVDAIHHQDVAASVVPPPVPARVVAVVTKKQAAPARPVKLAPLAVEAKPAPIIQPQTGVDSHGLVGQVPGIQIRLPWRIP